VDFYLIYIKEAHPIDAWQSDSNLKESVLVADPRQYGERVELAGTCSTKLGIEFPALIDDMENTTERNYTAWPDRIYLIDEEGRVAFKSEAGPFGFKTESLSDALQHLFSSKAQ
jgi:hypothetical protein